MLFKTHSTALLALAFVTPIFSQEPPLNMTKVSQWKEAGNTYADVWADGNYMYGAHYGASKIDIIDISIPGAPMKVATYNCANTGASAQELTVKNGALFVGLEANGSDDVEIVDVRNPAAPVLKRKISFSGLNHVHNLVWDNGFLYLVDSRQQLVYIVDMRTFNIADPPGATITTYKYLLNLNGTAYGGSGFVHDIAVKNGRMYCCDWDAGMWAYDISNLDAGPPVFLAKVQADNCHSADASDDNKWVVACDERNGGALRLYQFIDNGPNASQFVLRDSYQIPVTRAICVHDAFFVGNRIYCSWYHAGVQVFDVDRDRGRLYLTASYDTTAASGSSGYDGCWGVYPFLGRDKILAADLGQGFFVLQDNAFYVDFVWPDGPPEFTAPDLSTPIRIKFESDTPPDTNSVVLRAKVNGGSQLDIPMVQVGDEYHADLPAAPCNGRIEYWVDATFGAAGLRSDPPAGQGHFFAHPAVQFAPVLADDFEADKGWGVTNIAVSGGAWTRMNPTTAPHAPAADHSEPGTRLFSTGNAIIGGPTILTSPALDFGLGDGHIDFYYWFYNDDGDDVLTVEISNNGSNWVPVENLTGSGGGWRRERITVGDYVTPSNSVQIRLTAKDNPNDSVTTAAIDDVLAERYICDTTQLSGTVKLLNLVPSPAGRTMDIELRTPGAKVAKYTYHASVDANGHYGPVSVVSGTWDVSLKHANWLRKTLSNVSITGASATASFDLTNGDANLDNAVNLYDVNAVLIDFADVGPGDLDSNGIVDLADLNITLINFSLVGDQ